MRWLGQVANSNSTCFIGNEVALWYKASLFVSKQAKTLVLWNNSLQEVKRRSGTSRYHGSTISGWQPTTTATARRTAKNNTFILTNNNFARASRYFVHFLPSLHHYDMKLPNFTSPLYGVGKHSNKNCRFLFLNLDNDRYCPKENFAKICQIKWSWIRSVKFEIVRIDFKVTLSVCCHPKILLPWQLDVTTSPLYSSQI